MSPSEESTKNDAEQVANSPRRLMSVVFQQAWGLCVAYLAIGLVAELARRGGLKLGASAQSFLDSLPLFVMHHAGLIESYLRAVVAGQLTPFWNRALLSSVTIGVILIQATLTGLILLGAMCLLHRRPRHPTI
jgi:hypothetical protein